MPLDKDRPGVVKVGEFMGFPVYVDASLKPDEAVMVSTYWDQWAQRLRERDTVRITGLKLK